MVWRVIVGKQVKDVHWPPQGSTSLKIGDVLTIVIDPHCEQELYQLFG